MNREKLTNTSIIVKNYVDNYGNPIDRDIVSEKHQVSQLEYKIKLDELPSEYPIQIKKLIDTRDSIADPVVDFVEVIGNITSNNQFKIDRVTGFIEFHPSQKGKTVLVSYKSKGIEMIGMGRIFTEFTQQGDIRETLLDLINRSEESLNSINSVGDSVAVITQLNANIESSKHISDLLNENVQKANNLNTELEINIPSAEFTNTNIQNSINDGNRIIEDINIAGEKYKDVTEIQENIAKMNETIKHTSKIVVTDAPPSIREVNTFYYNITDTQAVGNGGIKVGHNLRGTIVDREVK